MTHLPAFALIGFVLAIAAVPATASSPSRYSVTVLNTYDSYYTRPGQLNNRGDYTLEHHSDSPRPDSQSLFRADGRYVTGANGFGQLNDAGQAAAYEYSSDMGPGPYPLVWTGTAKTYPAQNGVPFWGSAINNHGQVTGGFSLSSPYDGAFQANQIYDINTGGFTQIGSLGGKTDIAGINDDGKLVGSSVAMDGVQHAFVYENGVMTDLGTFGGTAASANWVNNRGDFIVSARNGYDSSFFTGIYSGGSLVDLTQAIGNGYILAFNDLGQILFQQSGGWRLWQDGQVHDLASLIDNTTAFPSLERVGSMNDRGEILAMTCPEHNPYECAMVKLMPIAAVPEPGTWAMLACGLVLLSPALRRRSRTCVQIGADVPHSLQ